MDVKEALELFTKTRDYWSDIYTAARVSTRFSIGLDHWSDKEIAARGGKHNCLTLPILPQFIHQVMNDMRQNTPSINILPGEGEGSDKETAKIFKGLIRSIEYKSKADSVYDTAGECAVRGGFGFILIEHDYVSEDSFLQELRLRRCQNPAAVYIDRNSVAIDGSDSDIGFVLDDITKDDFEKKYKGKAFVSFDDRKTDAKDETIKICEVYVKKYEELKKELGAENKMVDWVDSGNEETENKKTTRTLKKVTIERYKFSGADELEKTTFPGKYIPIIPCYGEEVWVDGKRTLLSLISLAMDAQRRLNKWATKESDLLDMAPISPVQAPVGAVDDFMKEWGKPGEVNVMRYNQFDSEGRPLNKPERLPPPTIPTGIVNAMVECKDSVKEALGMYSASIGQKSNAISGVAYDSQKVEGEIATYHFGDNRNKSIEQVGRVFVSAIPEVYDTDRIIQIVGDEENPVMVGINGAPLQDGQKQEHDLRKGQYDVRVTTSASYTTKRQEAAALLGDALKNNPTLMGVIGDLYFKNLDVAGADAIAARVRKTIDPKLIADEEAEKGGKPPVDPEKEQMAQHIEQAESQLQQVMGELQSKQAEDQAKILEQQNKAKELEIKQFSEQSKARLDGIKLDLEKEKLEIEKQKAVQGSTPVIDAQDQDIKERDMRLKEAEFELKAQLAKLDVIRTAQEDAAPQEGAEPVNPEQQEIDTAQKAEQNKQLADIKQTIEGLIAAISKPIEVVRDENGVITGAE